MYRKISFQVRTSLDHAMEPSLKDTSKDVSQPRQCSDVLLPTRAVNHFHPSKSYGEVLTTIINFIQDEAKENDHDGEDPGVVAWSSTYYDDPIMFDYEASFEETNRYLSHTMNVLEQWNRERVMYLYDRRMSSSTRGQLYDQRVFRRNDPIWLRNSPSLDIMLERVTVLKNSEV